VCACAADDNVHLQNAAELSKVLVKQGVNFEQMYYTNCILSPPPSLRCCAVCVSVTLYVLCACVRGAMCVVRARLTALWMMIP
jgi:hypothetical protein